MVIKSNMRQKIRKDSIPSVRTMGMLGDRYMEISFGSPDSPVLQEDEILVGKGATDFDDTLREAKATLNESTKLLSAINQQQGTIGQFLSDSAFYNHLNDVATEMNELLKDFKKNPRRYIKFSLF